MTFHGHGMKRRNSIQSFVMGHITNQGRDGISYAWDGGYTTGQGTRDISMVWDGAHQRLRERRHFMCMGRRTYDSKADK